MVPFCCDWHAYIPRLHNLACVLIVLFLCLPAGIAVHLHPKVTCASLLTTLSEWSSLLSSFEMLKDKPCCLKWQNQMMHHQMSQTTRTTLVDSSSINSHPHSCSLLTSVQRTCHHCSPLPRASFWLAYTAFFFCDQMCVGCS